MVLIGHTTLRPVEDLCFLQVNISLLYRVFTRFSPWSWFTSVVDELIEECELDADKCTALIPVCTRIACIVLLLRLDLLTCVSLRWINLCSTEYSEVSQLVNESIRVSWILH